MTIEIAQPFELTHEDKLIYYLLNAEGSRGISMMGTVRVKGTCPVCHKPFKLIEQSGKKIGYICPKHLTIPERFFIDINWNGKRVKIYSDKTGQVLDSLDRANRLLVKINSEIEDHSFDSSKYVKKEEKDFWASTLLDRFYKDKIGSISPSRLSHYKRYTEVAKEYFKKKDIRELRKLDIINYKNYLIENYYSEQPKQGKTLKNVMDHFKTFLTYCLREYEILDKVPPFPVIETQEYLFKWVDQEDQIKIYEHVDDEDKPFVAFLMLHGCRPGEARALKCKDVSLKQGIITISATFSNEVYKERRKGKKAKAVMVPIHPEMQAYIRDRVKKNLPEAFLFTKRGAHYSETHIFRLWENVRKKAKLDSRIRLYDVTRHSFASQLVNSGSSIFKISRLMGHSSVKTTEKFYAHQSIASLKTDIEKMSLKKSSTVPRLSPDRKQDRN